jgi:DNA-binding transcriptional MocR family regulator
VPAIQSAGRLNGIAPPCTATRHVAALEKHFSTGAPWKQPAAGVFIWVELPEGTDASEVLRVAIEQEGVVFVPGNAFAADGSSTASNCMRLNFSHSTPEVIEEGIARLGRTLKALGV